MMKFKLKPLVASMALLASGVAVAAGFVPPESAPAPVVVDRLDKALERNHNGRFAEPNDWFRRITLSGEVNIDATVSNRTQSATNRFGANKSSDIALDDANLYLGAKLSDWVMANVDWVYHDSRGIYASANQDVTNSTSNIDEVYLTVGNFRQSPLYLLVGKEYIPYGVYTRHPMTETLPQFMTETNATTAQVGFVGVNGFNGSIFAFRNTVPRNATIKRIENGGAQIGYRFEQGDAGFNLDASYLANMADVDYAQTREFESHDSNNEPITISFAEHGVHKTVPGYALVAQAHSMGFDGEVQYTAAGKTFNSADISWRNGGAKPKAWLVGVGYSFPAAGGHTSRVGVNYQASRQAVNFGQAGLPKKRWQADYAVNLWKNTDLGFEYVYDKDYKTSDGGTGSSSSTGIVRLSARFA